MIMTFTNDEYSKSYTELLEIFKYFSKSDFIRIPKDIIKRYIRDKDKNYNFSYNPDLEIDKQNVSKLTQILLANLYIDYFVDENEQEILRDKDLKVLAQLEKRKQEEYNIEKIFDKRKEKIAINDTTEITCLSVIEEKENIFRKIIYKIKHFLKLT